MFGELVLMKADAEADHPTDSKVDFIEGNFFDKYLKNILQRAVQLYDHKDRMRGAEAATKLQNDQFESD